MVQQKAVRRERSASLERHEAVLQRMDSLQQQLQESKEHNSLLEHRLSSGFPLPQRITGPVSRSNIVAETPAARETPSTSNNSYVDLHACSLEQNTHGNDKFQKQEVFDPASHRR